LEGIGFGVVVLLTVILGNRGLVDGAAASEWSLGPAEDFTTAFINLTYMEGDKLHTEKSDVSQILLFYSQP
jgi:hypothetical protein